MLKTAGARCGFEKLDVSPACDMAAVTETRNESNRTTRQLNKKSWCRTQSSALMRRGHSGLSVAASAFPFEIVNVRNAGARSSHRIRISLTVRFQAKAKFA